MNVIVAAAAQPQQVVLVVVASLTPERLVVGVDSCAFLTNLARVAKTGETKSPQCLRIAYTAFWTWVRGHLRA